MKKELLKKGKKYLALMLAFALAVSMVSWSNLVVKAQKEVTLTIQQQDGTGEVTEIVIKSYVTPGSGITVTPEDGILKDGKITKIPEKGNVTFRIKPENGKYLEKVVWMDSDTNEIVTPDEAKGITIEEKEDGTYIVSVAEVKEDAVISCIYGTIVSGESVNLTSYFSVKKVSDSSDAYFVSDGNRYYADANGFELQPQSGIALKFGSDTVYSSSVRQYGTTAIEGFYVEKTAEDNTVSYEKVETQVRLQIDSGAAEVTGIEFLNPNTESSESSAELTDELPVKTSYGYYFQEEAEVKVYADDNMSGVKSISYRLADITDEGERAFITPQLQTENGKSYISFTIPANFKGQIYLYATDQVGNGNSGNAVSPDGIVVENENQHKAGTNIAIELPAASDTDSQGKNIYTDDVEIPVTVSSEYSGLQKVTWSITSADQAENGQTETIGIDNDGIITTADGSSTTEDNKSAWTKTEDNNSNLITSVKKTLKVKNDSSKVTLKVTLTDRAGFTTTEEREFSIDKKEPEITGIQFDDNKNTLSGADVVKTDYGYYFKNSTTVTVTAKDSSSGVKSITYRSVNIDGTEETKTINAVDNKISFTISANFKGRIFVYATDYVGKMSAQVQSEGLIVETESWHDSKASISAKLPETPYTDGKGRNLYQASVPITIRAVDAYNGLAELEWEVTYGSDKKTEQSGKIAIANGGKLSGDTSGWDKTDEGNSNLVTKLEKEIEIGIDSNNITLTVILTDRAGYETRTVKVLSIDKTVPEIEVTYNKEESPSTSMDKDYKRFFKNDRKATITIHERNFDEEAADIAVKKALKSADEVTISGWESRDKLAGISDGAEYTCTITYSDSSAYNFSMSVTDMAGNTGKYTPDIFMVDKKNPTLDKDNFKISATDRDTVKKYTDADGVLWYNQNVDISFTAKDTCSGLYQVATSAFAMNGLQGKFKKDVKEIYGLEEYRVQEVNYGKRGETQEQGYTVSTNTGKNKSEKYQLAVEAADYAGNEAKMQSKVIGIDTKKPRITGITFEGVGNQDSIWKNSTTVYSKDYGYYFREKATVKITATDVNESGFSGVKSISYRLADITDKQEREFITPELQTDGTECYITFEIPEGFKGQIYAYATDNVGNQGDEEQPDGTVKESPEQQAEANIEISGPATSYQDEKGRPLYASDTTFHIIAEDIHSGLQKVEWSVESAEDSDSNQSGFVEVSGDGTVTDSSWSMTGTDENLVTRLEKDITVRNNSNNIKLKVTLTDRAGNVTEYNAGNGLVFSIDKTKPEIEVTYLENDPSNEKYYNKDRTAVITVTERNFDEEATNRQIQITNTDGTIPVYGTWTHGGVAGTDQATHTCTITYAADGDYTFTMTAADKADNSTVYGNVDEFTIDQTKPEINVSYSTADLSNNIYYKGECVATITVTEHNFNEAGVEITQLAQLDGQTISAPASTGWSSNGDTHTATIHYNSDGDYTLNVACQDSAANEAESYTGTEFVVDMTEPEIEITDVEDMTAYNGTVAPGVTFSDVNCDAQSVKIVLSGYKHDERDLTGSLSAAVHGGSIQLEDFEHTAETDDVYTLTAQVTDLAGNSTEVSKVFSVNRYGSNYILSDDTQNLVDNYYTNQEEELVIREINVSSLKTEGITYSRDGELQTLEEGKDYEVQDKGTEYASWKEYTYTVYADNFQDEGAYTVTVLSTDGAENSMTNRTAKTKDYTKEVEFVIDKTAPTSVISGVENNRQYIETEHEVKIDSQDNVAIDAVEVYLNDKGTPAATWTQEELMANDGIMSYVLKAASQWQNLRVVAVDKAGNRSESDTIRCLLTTNMLVQFFNNRILVGGTAAVLIMGAGGCYWTISLRRRKKQRSGN